MAAVALEKSGRCQMCGTAEFEWEEDPFAYDAVRFMCPGCMRRDTMSDDPDQPLAKGVSIRLLPRATAAALEQARAAKEAEGTLRPRRRRSSEQRR